MSEPTFLVIRYDIDPEDGTLRDIEAERAADAAEEERQRLADEFLAFSMEQEREVEDGVDDEESLDNCPYAKIPHCPRCQSDDANLYWDSCANHETRVAFAYRMNKDD
jgi:hypothetical protein